MLGFFRRLLPIALAAVLPLSSVGAGAGEHTVPSVRIMQSHPALFGQLSGDQAIFVRLAYSSETPVRFRIEGYAEGEKVTQARSNPTPRYPAGEGEALVWMAFDAPVLCRRQFTIEISGKLDRHFLAGFFHTQVLIVTCYIFWIYHLKNALLAGR